MRRSVGLTRCAGTGGLWLAILPRDSIPPVQNDSTCQVAANAFRQVTSDTATVSLSQSSCCALDRIAIWLEIQPPARRSRTSSSSLLTVHGQHFGRCSANDPCPAAGGRVVWRLLPRCKGPLNTKGLPGRGGPSVPSERLRSVRAPRLSLSSHSRRSRQPLRANFATRSYIATTVSNSSRTSVSSSARAEAIDPLSPSRGVTGRSASRTRA